MKLCGYRGTASAWLPRELSKSVRHATRTRGGFRFFRFHPGSPILVVELNYTGEKPQVCEIFRACIAEKSMARDNFRGCWHRSISRSFSKESYRFLKNRISRMETKCSNVLLHARVRVVSTVFEERLDEYRCRSVRRLLSENGSCVCLRMRIN